MKRLIAFLPVSVGRPVRILAWLSLAFQLVLIGTGGAVRLTGSGLGCPTWPRCTDSSFVSTPEMGIHGIIEFANRMLTFVLALIVIAVFLAVVRYWRERRDLFVLTLLQGLSIPLQAVIGGITVLTGLNPFIVGVHFVISILLVVNATILVYRVYRGPRGARRAVPLWYLIVAHIASLFVAITVVVGILTTGSGPHAGDEKTPRNGLDAELLQHFHSWPAYVLVGLTLVLVVAAWVLKLDVRRWVLTLLAVEAVQVAVGLAQARLGLPPLLVGIHMVLAGLLVAAMTTVVLSLRSTANVPESVDDPWELTSAGQRS
ncbi:COX15/CtaA family protein [Agreia sp. VKM Ac-1783]|uniref:COX15/CtaA family protein n=1 Tax=Agreia sp. VKM Ac-1783 TaxID=1938889 RepID=UPI000A2AAA64|nr:COX15/CtaA family protein [Agreia sp. VKM Ac-1783]SMQ67632.1 cytochrome c oxidase assembly protein subunit 15 [Agreia sp. VKM Ac-1783]